MRLKSRFRICSTFCFLLLCAGTAGAQFEQYTPPGGPQQRPQSREDRLKQEIAEARYHLGPVKIAPSAGIRDVAYVRNLFGEGSDTTTSDWTATGFAGARAFLRTGRKMTWIGTVLPQYVWWAHRSEARRLNTTYGLEGVGLFNRLFLGVAASREENQRFITPELPQLFSFRSDVLEATAEVRLSGAISTFVNVRENGQKSLVKDSSGPEERIVSQLDRTEQVARAGVRWRPRPRLTFGVGAEQSRVDFDRGAADSSNEGTAPFLEVLADGNKIFFGLDAAARSLTARNGSRFVPFDGVTGAVSASYRPYRSLELWVYGNRGLIYSFQAAYPYLDDRRIGTAVRVGAGERLSMRFYVEAGTDDYTPLVPGTPDRSDDVRSYGGQMRLLLTDQITLNLQVTRSRFDSNLPINNRSFSSGGVSVTLGSQIF
jgi:hypothetical protein